jgi:hypothetical protein
MSGAALDLELVVAFHEAGHALAYCHFGWRFKAVRLIDAADGGLRGGLKAPAGNYSLLGKAICALAGPVAEEWLTGVAIHEQPGSRTDIMMALNALARVTARGEPIELAGLLPCTRLLIEEQWVSVGCIAETLIARRRLDYDETLRLLG